MDKKSKLGVYLSCVAFGYLFPALPVALALSMPEMSTWFYVLGAIPWLANGMYPFTARKDWGREGYYSTFGYPYASVAPGIFSFVVFPLILAKVSCLLPGYLAVWIYEQVYKNKLEPVQPQTIHRN